MRTGRTRIVFLAAAAAVLAAALTTGALAGSQGKTQTAKRAFKNALKQEQAALKDLRAGNDAGADKHLRASQKALVKAGNTLGPQSDSGWDASDAWNHDQDALEDPCRACAEEDILDGIDHKRWALLELTARFLLLGWPIDDFGGNALYYLGSGLYSTGYNANAIGNLEGKTLNTYPVPTASSGLRDLTKGSDGAIWFTEPAADKIGRFDPSTHAFTEFPLSTPFAGPYGIAPGPDGALWFTESGANNIGRITTSGQVTEYPIPTANSYSVAIAAGPDKALWFAELEGNTIGRITTSGQVTEYPIPTAGAELSGIAAGPGGLWFTEYGTGKVGVISTKGKIKEFDTPSSGSGPWQIVRGPDGDMWFTEYNANKIGVVTSGGTIHEFPAAGGPSGIAASKTTLYYEEYTGNKIGVVKLKK
jgi:virginiamycin B lyase